MAPLYEYIHYFRNSVAHTQYVLKVKYKASETNLVKSTMMHQVLTKSLQISRAVRHFYGTEFEIWSFLGMFFFKFCSVRTKKFHRVQVKNPQNQYQRYLTARLMHNDFDQALYVTKSCSIKIGHVINVCHSPGGVSKSI